MKQRVSSLGEQRMMEGAGTITARGPEAWDTRNRQSCPCATPESSGANKLQCTTRLSLLTPPVWAAKCERLSKNTLGRCLSGTEEEICRHSELGKGTQKGPVCARQTAQGKLHRCPNAAGVSTSFTLGHICCTGRSATLNTPYVCPILRHKHRCKVEQVTAKI